MSPTGGKPVTLAGGVAEALRVGALASTRTPPAKRSRRPGAYSGMAPRGARYVRCGLHGSRWSRGYQGAGSNGSDRRGAWGAAGAARRCWRDPGDHRSVLQRLDAEYASLCRKLVAKLARKRPSPLERGDRRIWAAGAIYAVGANNFLFDPARRHT